MDVTRAYKFSIYPDVKRQKEIDERLVLAKEFYNLILEKTIRSYKDGNANISMAALNRFAKETEEDRKYLRLYSQTRCEIKFRILKAYKNFFGRVKEREKGKRIKAGFPRFKSIDRYKSIIYPQDNGAFSIEKSGKRGMLRISRIGRVRIELHRPIEGRIKTLTIKRDAGRYYAIFVATKEAGIPKMEDTNPVGIDVGLKTFAVLSDGTRITKPNFRKNAEKHIARWQRIVARRKRGSKRRQFAKERMSREYRIANNQTNDYLQKVTDKLVNSGYTSFAVEKLQIQNMVKNRKLAKTIHYASWNRFIHMLSYKAESAGMEVIEVNPQNTTMACSNCGSLKSMPLSKRVYYCEVCGLNEDRDINASINILKRGRAGRARTDAQGDFVRPHQEAVIEGLRTYPDGRGSLGL